MTRRPDGSGSEPLVDTVVEVASHGTPEGRRYGYGSAAEAEHQADNWVALGIAFATDGTRWSDVRHGDRIVRVRGYDSGQVSVSEQHRGDRRVWDRAEIGHALERHGLRRRALQRRGRRRGS